ncbi:hypothetical protein QQS21_004230 [Conoideocrella luteorostrata]|uniref:Uncharacterized protein n=1 Tax=Conoideocrella luteorostrata TaxID=1105319 RepID=A0AAJ0FVM4_9HYPO|nr:hypothetical protein QQS21_004230 [Conoideocrella luteorostrata]
MAILLFIVIGIYVSQKLQRFEQHIKAQIRRVKRAVPDGREGRDGRDGLRGPPGDRDDGGEAGVNLNDISPITEMEHRSINYAPLPAQSSQPAQQVQPVELAQSQTKSTSHGFTRTVSTAANGVKIMGSSSAAKRETRREYRAIAPKPSATATRSVGTTNNGDSIPCVRDDRSLGKSRV